ncbi:protein NPAT isoform X2 [Eleutherodactylus coqui]|uniref:protein NPAT isoform X2 n=1 Tax=Eleutherodactylus coqui TaxID=57060 RepID=UPI003462B635
MLLPSDVARLVLGYLQQEKLPSTCRSFIAESPSLKEYAEHHTDDGTIPGCLLSLFGKNLTTILNEYITMKAKENQQEIPFMMSSLWKKLDLTLSQIRSMQESAAVSNHQRGLPTSHPVIQQTSTPIMATQYILRPLHTTGALQPIASSSFGGESTVQNNNSTSISLVEPAQSTSVVCTPRKPLPTATASPMRRKQDIQRRRRAAPLSSSTAASDGDLGECVDNLQALIDNNFPQMVIENAREKILSNKSLQEKLAESINKFLVSDSTAQSSKQADGTTAEQDTSIDEILGLQGGEMHMSEEAIHDILTQTELDPDFQELYDLFACVTSKAPKTCRDPSTGNNDPKNTGTGKGKKQDVTESGSIECAKKLDICSNGKEGTNLSGQDKSLVDQTSELPSTSQQASANEGSNLENRTSSCDNQNIALVATESTDGEHFMDTDLPGAEEEVTSQIQDVERKNISLSKEGAAYGFHIAEDILPSNTSIADKSISISAGTVNEEPKDIPAIEVTSSAAPSVETWQDARKNDPIIPSLTNVAGPLHKQKTNEQTHCPEQSPTNQPGNAATNQQVNTAEIENSPLRELTPQNAVINIEHTACPGQISVPPEGATLCISMPGTSETILDDSSIVTLITEDLPEDTELSAAVKSINGDYATIILSPLVKNQELKTAIPSQENCIIDLTDSSLLGEQAQLLTRSSDCSISIGTLSGDCSVYSLSGTSSNSGENSVIQLMPAAGSTFAPTGNIYINNRMANSGTAVPPNIVMLANSSSSQNQPSLFQTPPRPGSMYAVGQTMSPKFSQGSTIILASPVQPVLQGVVGMFPVSLVGQSGSTFTAPSHQLLHVPLSKPIVPKLPLPPRPQKPPPSKPNVNTGKSLSSLAVDSASGSSGSFVQRLGNEGKRSEAISKPVKTVPDLPKDIAREVEAHKRVLCFDGTSSAMAKSASLSSTNSKSQKNDGNDTVQKEGSSSGTVTSSRSNGNKKNKSSVVKNQKVSTTSTASAKDQVPEKRPTASSGGTLGNKENVLQVKTGKQGAAQVDKRSNTKESEKNAKRPQETNKKPTSVPNILRRTPQKVPSERVCPTSPLVKQASQLLQGMQSPTSKPSSQGDLLLPSTPGSRLEDKPLAVDQTRTPTNKRYNEDGGTPKPMFPPATPDMPTCSPASETGSENSVNMAAHTLMILSRASLGKSSGNTPLKDNTQQLKSSKGASKKRKLEETEEVERQAHKKDLLSQSDMQNKKKTKKNQKKSVDNFPAEMDVDKFLMSLHYDE